MKKRNSRLFVCDFETTVYEGQESTEVWSSACVELFKEEVHIFHSIDEQYDFFKSLDENIICYFHNLKFDGEFWLSYLLIQRGFTQALDNPNDLTSCDWQNNRDMKNNSVSYSISNMGQWYRIAYKVRDHIIELRDSYKLLPFTLKRVGDSFKTQHRKLDMEYKGFRYAGCKITPEEEQYIRNDVLVLKEALELMYQEGHTKLTIGSCCLAEYHKSIGNKAYKEYFPNVYETIIDHGDTKVNAGEWIKKSYRGGWCYLAKGKENQLKRNGTTADVNSLYPSMMSSESLNKYPIGQPTFWFGNFIPEEAKSEDKYYFIKIRTRFQIKENKLPFIQIKSSLLYKSTEMLETSDIYDKRTEKYFRYYKDGEGKIKEAKVELTLTMTDWILLQEHYDLFDLEIIEGCYFNSAVGIFDAYIEKYRKIKIESKGAKRELAKLFLNNLYGKMASSTKSSFKVAYIKEDQTLGYYTVDQNKKAPGYIPVGSAITSYSRNFTIRAAQKNYYGKDKPGFIYADTDSIHCDLAPEEIKGITVDPVAFCCWKLEKCWDKGLFVRQKTYIEHVVKEDLEPVEAYYSITCAGMPEKSKQLFLKSMGEKTKLDGKEDDLTAEEIDFIEKSRSLKDFKVGLEVPGKLQPKRIPGGVVLKDVLYTMH